MAKKPNSENPGLPPVLISACLLGLPARYDGRILDNISLPAQFEGRLLIPVCPEQLGGLPTPRHPQELRGGCGPEVLAGRARVVNSEGIDVTENFIAGARAVCRIAELTGAHEALLKEGSPSCGITRVTVDGEETAGQGVAAAALEQLGLKLWPCG